MARPRVALVGQYVFLTFSGAELCRRIAARVWPGEDDAKLVQFFVEDDCHGVRVVTADFAVALRDPSRGRLQLVIFDRRVLRPEESYLEVRQISTSRALTNEGAVPVIPEILEGIEMEGLDLHSNEAIAGTVFVKRQKDLGFCVGVVPAETMSETVVWKRRFHSLNGYRHCQRIAQAVMERERASEHVEAVIEGREDR